MGEVILAGLPESVIVQIYLNHLSAIERLEGKGTQNLELVRDVLKETYPELLEDYKLNIGTSRKRAFEPEKFQP